MAVKPCGVTYFSPLRGRADSVTTGMSLSSLMAGPLYGETALFQRRQPLGRAHVAPVAPVQLAAQLAGRDGPLEQRQQRKLAGLAAREELRAVNAHAGIREAIRVALDDEVAVEPEVPARVMRRIRHQHQVRMRIALELQIAPKSMSVHMSPFTTRNGAGPSSGSALKMPPPVSSATGPSSL